MSIYLPIDRSISPSICSISLSLYLSLSLSRSLSLSLYLSLSLSRSLSSICLSKSPSENKYHYICTMHPLRQLTTDDSALSAASTGGRACGRLIQTSAQRKKGPTNTRSTTHHRRARMCQQQRLTLIKSSSIPLYLGLRLIHHRRANVLRGADGFPEVIATQLVLGWNCAAFVHSL